MESKRKAIWLQSKGTKNGIILNENEWIFGKSRKSVWYAERDKLSTLEHTVKTENDNDENVNLLKTFKHCLCNYFDVDKKYLGLFGGVKWPGPLPTKPEIPGLIGDPGQYFVTHAILSAFTFFYLQGTQFVPFGIPNAFSTFTKNLYTLQMKLSTTDY